MNLWVNGMNKPIVRDMFFLGQKSDEATMEDMSVAVDLQDTLRANKDRCIGMAANMIGVKKRIIIVDLGLASVVMFNPVIIHKDAPYEAEEGCLSLSGTRKTIRYMNIEVEFMDMGGKRQIQKYTGRVAQIIQHECDHLEGIII